MNKKRQQAEELVYQVMDKLDKTKTNSTKYREIFANMDDKQFEEFLMKKFPFKFYYKPFEIEPKLVDVVNALKVMGVPLAEKVKLNYLYKNKDGQAVSSIPCIVVYLHIKNLKQFIAKKNGMSVNITNRDMRTGLLLSDDKGGRESDREFESLMVNGCEATLLELSRPRADSMNAKNIMYNTINATGRVSIDDVPIEHDDPLSKNLIDVYLLGAGLKSNLIIGPDYMTPLTMKDKKRRVEREGE